MSSLQILHWPDPRLRQVCAPLDLSGGVPEEVTHLATEMLDAMYGAEGRGLAAPQVGVLQRLFVMDCGWKEGEMTPLICLNPEVLDRSEEQESGSEGCLSIPGVPVEVTRPAAILLRWQGLDGRVTERWLEGFEARCAQHEIDHLDGRVIFDHLDADTRARLERAYQEARP